MRVMQGAGRVAGEMLEESAHAAAARGEASAREVDELEVREIATEILRAASWITRKQGDASLRADHFRHLSRRLVTALPFYLLQDSLGSAGR